MIGAMGLGGFRGFMTVDAPTSAEVLRSFVKHELVPRLRTGDLVVCDNLSVHKDREVLALIRAAGADVLYLPPYSPEFNPIEQAWSKLKELLRRAETLTREAFDAAVASALAVVSNSDIQSWIQYAGYSL